MRQKHKVPSRSRRRPKGVVGRKAKKRRQAMTLREKKSSIIKRVRVAGMGIEDRPKVRRSPVFRDPAKIRLAGRCGRSIRAETWEENDMSLRNGD